MNSPSPPSKTTISQSEASDPEKLLVSCLGDKTNWPKELVNACAKNKECKIALGLTLVFLEKLLLLDTALPVSSFEYCEGIGFTANNKAMLIDAQAIEHLDILPVRN